MDIVLSTERFVIISSGSVIIPANDFVEFEIERLRFRVSMVENRSDPARKYQTNLESDEKGKCMVISLINFSESFFATPHEELRVARLNGKGLFLKFSLTAINKSGEGYDGLLFYTWMLTKEDEVVYQNVENNAGEQ